MDSKNSDHGDKKMRLGIIGAGFLATGLIVASFNSTLAGFTASIANSVNNASMGTLTLQETNIDGSIACASQASANNAATCVDINKYSGIQTLKPNEKVTTQVTLKNTGTIDASSFTLVADTCKQTATSSIGTATDFCTKANVNILQDGVSVYNGAPSGLTNVTLKTLKAGQSGVYTFEISTPDTLDNTYQGLKLDQVLTWKLAA